MATSNEKARNAASAERRADIVAAARELYEEQGLSKTSVQDITNRMGVARSLFYHYFPDKEAVTSAVLDDYVADFIEATHYWNAQRRSLASHENAALYIDFVNRVADRVATYIVDTTVRDYGALHEIRIEHVYETFYVLILGIVGYLRTHPDVDDEVLKDLIAQTLHMDRGANGAPESG